VRDGFKEDWAMDLVRRSMMAIAVAVIAMGMVGRPALAADAAGDVARPDRAVALTLEAGIVALTLGLELEAQTRWGLVAGAGAGVRGGPAVNGYVGYHVSLGEHWGLRPGVRAGLLRQQNDSCPHTCSYESLIVDAAIRYRGTSGFVFEYGLPLFGWVPVGPDAGETGPHLKAYSIATGDLALYGTLLVGYSF
jgi:hypothetical protein